VDEAAGVQAEDDDDHDEQDHVVHHQACAGTWAKNEQVKNVHLHKVTEEVTSLL
jgi:hypothetical protein